MRVLNQDKVTLIDVREPNEIKNGGVIKGAKKIPLADLSKRMAEFQNNKQDPVVIYCRSGSRSGHACNTLTKNGFEQVYNLAGGILAWESGNLPLSKRWCMQAEVIIYSTRFCPYCMRARKLLKSKNVDFEEISVGFNQKLWQEMEEKSGGGTTVPQIFINGQAIGGYDDMAKLDRDGQLDTLLQGN